jgi:hypothetical protein
MTGVNTLAVPLSGYISRLFGSFGKQLGNSFLRYL